MDDIIYFVPIYEKNLGAITKVLWENGKEEKVRVSCKGYLSKLCRQYTVDGAAMKKKYGKLIGSVNCVPMPLSSHMLLIPIRVIKPIAKSDGAMGYVNYYHIKECIADEEGGAELIFKDNTTLKPTTKYKTVQKSIKDARIISEYYKEQSGVIRHADLNDPVIKTELELLATLLLKLKNSLNM